MEVFSLALPPRLFIDAGDVSEEGVEGHVGLVVLVIGGRWSGFMVLSIDSHSNCPIGHQPTIDSESEIIDWGRIAVRVPDWAFNTGHDTRGATGR